MFRILRYLVLAAFVLAVPACASMHGKGSMKEDPQQRTTVKVENQAWVDVNVYVVRETQRVRLGQVPAHSTQVFPIPSYLATTAARLAFFVDPIGSPRTAQSYDMSVYPGDQVTLTIPVTAFQ
ncbi:MAG TPA: hypothetical protein VFE05_22760 [Longimicrobiaceae bacterium]|jgi:hypothetical protein|nr:hypothetical protein [Longimicrobiaceae bacterium]